MDLELTLSSLQDKGLRITKIRKGIISIFSKSTKPLSANEVEQRLIKTGISVNNATVHRQLQFLLANGNLIEVYLDSHKVSYESSELKHHHHLICRVCGSIDNITNCLINDLSEDVYKKKGFKIERHMLEFYGTCMNCSKNA